MRPFIALSLLLLSSCSTVRHVTDAKNAWISREVSNSDTLYYCVANEDGKGDAAPRCHEARRFRATSQDEPKHAPAP